MKFFEIIGRFFYSIAMGVVHAHRFFKQPPVAAKTKRSVPMLTQREWEGF